jgi:tetraacyldisaccharide 4'-kinase
LYEEHPGRFRRALASIYGAAVNRRLARYRDGRLAVGRLAAWAVSVGNLTVGGTGKTPAAIYIAGHFKRQGLRAAMLSRGYKGRSRSPIGVVSYGERLRMEPDASGDEACLMARALPGVPVLTGKDRLVLGRFAIERFGAEALVLDDGYQHLRVARDVNLLLLDAARPWGNGRLLPAGPLREPRAEAARATAFLLTRVGEPTDALEAELARDFPGRPVFRSRHRPEAWKNFHEAETRPADGLDGRPVLAFCGLARPEHFLTTLEGLGVNVAGFVAWPDHFQARPGDLRYLAAKARSLGVDAAVTTAKDAVKLSGRDMAASGFPLNLWVLEIALEIIEREDEFLKLVAPPREKEAGS